MRRLENSGGTDKLELLRVILRLDRSSKSSVRSFTDFLCGDGIKIGGGVFLARTNDIFGCLGSVGLFGMLQHFAQLYLRQISNKGREREWVEGLLLLLLSLA